MMSSKFGVGIRLRLKNGDDHKNGDAEYFQRKKELNISIHLPRKIPTETAKKGFESETEELWGRFSRSDLRWKTLFWSNRRLPRGEPPDQDCGRSDVGGRPFIRSLFFRIRVPSPLSLSLTLERISTYSHLLVLLDCPEVEGKS